MFVVLITYVRPLEAVDAVLEAHREFLRQHYAAGVFLLSGPRSPRNGGVILATAPSGAELEAILARDPFAAAGVASYQVVEFTPTMAAAGLDSLVAG